VSDPEQLTPQEEKRIEKRFMDLSARSLSQDFPNPERMGCPDSAVLRGIAFHQLQLADVERWLDHLGTCSPCFRQCSQFRREGKRQRRQRKRR